MSGVPCAGCERALSTHWVRKHWACMRGQPVCNCCRSRNVPVQPTKLERLTGAPYPPSGEAMSGSVWSDPFLGADVENTTGVATGYAREAP
jgi:hypothetical protein